MQTESEPNAQVEPHWPAVVAVLVAAALNFFLPAGLSAGPGWLVVALVAVLAMAGMLLPQWHVWLGHLTVGITTLVLAHALAELILDLTSHHGNSRELLRAAAILWSMNVLVFASWYWRLDAGGPHRRSRQYTTNGGAFLFPQLTLLPEIRSALNAENWTPRFIDYLFLAFNTSTAFSPTDVPVLSPWAKVLMMIQSLISLATVVMVGARAVNIL